jgi:plasmid maintenance system antidote protein VapI
VTLNAFLLQSGLTEAELAEKCEPPVRQHTINRIRRRARCASLEMALSIERATAGAVPALSLHLSRRTREALKRLRTAAA